MRTTTDIIIGYLRENPTGSLRGRLRIAVIAALIEIEEHSDFIDSHAIASLICEECRVRGQSPDWKQTKDYVQYVFREADFVCGHSTEHLGHIYRIHDSERCGPACKEREKHHHRHVMTDKGQCPSCFTSLPATGICGCQ